MNSFWKETTKKKAETQVGSSANEDGVNCKGTKRAGVGKRASRLQEKFSAKSTSQKQQRNVVKERVSWSWDGTGREDGRSARLV